jgi:hypothetical protein
MEFEHARMLLAAGGPVIAQGAAFETARFTAQGVPRKDSRDPTTDAPAGETIVAMLHLNPSTLDYPT